MNVYTYRVAYATAKSLGVCTITRNKPIQYGDDFVNMEETIAKQNGHKKVAILNVMRIKGLYRPVEIK